MTASRLPARPRWRAGVAGLAIAVASFTATACGGDEGDAGSGTENEVVEEGEVGVGEEDAGQLEDVAPGTESGGNDGGEGGDG